MIEIISKSGVFSSLNMTGGCFIEKLSFGPKDKETFRAVSIAVSNRGNCSLTACKGNPRIETLEYETRLKSHGLAR